MNREQRRAAIRAQRKPGAPRRRGGPILKDPLDYVLTGVQPLTHEQQQALGLRCHAALRSLTSGTGTSQDGADLAAMVEVTHALVEAVQAQARRVGDAVQMEVSEAALAIAERGREAALQASLRAARLQDRWALTGPELTALNECAELHDQFMQMAPQQFVEYAVTTARDRAIHKRNELLRNYRAPA